MLVGLIHQVQLYSSQGSQVLMMTADALGYYKLALLAISIMQQAPLVLIHCSPSNILILIWFPMWLSTATLVPLVSMTILFLILT